MSPVFSFDMGVIIFLVFSGTRVLDRATTMGPVFEEWPIEELSSVVTIKTTDFERERLLNGFKCTDDTLFAFAPDRSLFGPSCCDIDRIDGINEVAGSRSATVGNSVSFKEARSRLIPLVGFDGDMLFQERARFGRCQAKLLIS